MTTCHAFHYAHYEHVLIDRKVAFAIDRGKLELVGSHLIMTCLHRYAETKAHNLKVLHESLDARRNLSEIMVIHLLVLAGTMAHEGASCGDQVGARRIQVVVNEEILLFPAKIHLNPIDLGVEKLTHRNGCLIDSLEGLLERCLVVESFSRIRDEYSGNAETIVEDEYRRCGIPSSISASLKGGANTSRRET